MEEDDAEVGARRRSGGDDVAAVHVRVAARLEDEQPADVVEPLERVASLLEDRRAAQGLDPTRDDPERLAAGVVVDDLDARATAPAQSSEKLGYRCVRRPR